MNVPGHLKINHREQDQNFNENDKLYRGFELIEYDSDEATINASAVKFPDFSCNWSRYSCAKDIKYRLNAESTDGCYSFTVADSKFNNAAKPVHDPIDDINYPNYAHVEVRATRETDDINSIPPKNRKLSKGKKLQYRQHLSNNAFIEFMPTG